jgi:hypothetical protein
MLLLQVFPAAQGARPAWAAALLLLAGPAPHVETISPATAVGSAFTLTVVGHGFDAAAVVEVRRGEASPVVGRVTERSGTRLTATVPLAGSAPGAYEVAVVNGDGSRSNSAPLTLVDQVTITPRSGRPGTLFTYAGHGFTARIGAISHLQGPTATAFQSKRIVTSAEGTFEQQIDSAEFHPGTFTVWAVDDHTKIAAPAATFEIVR